MKASTTIAVLLVILICHCSPIGATSLTIHNNRYNDLVVAISPDIKEDITIINNIQEIITKASAFLYKATRKRAYFGNVRILVPETWTFNSEWIIASVQKFEEADIRIDKPSPVYGNTPYTFQPEGCGDPGKYIHLTKDFVLDSDGKRNSTYGPAERILVHEFSHLRYGVFDEYGIGTDEYPDFYLDGNVAYPTACTNSIRGNLHGNCNKDPATNLPENDCKFVGNLDQNTATVSVMYDAAITTVTTFCESDPTDTAYLHNHLAPNQQNKMCDKQGTWDVIKEHADFKKDNLPGDKTGAELKPFFKILYSGKTPVKSGDKEYEVCGRPVVLVLDISASMSGDRQFRQTQMADKLIKDVLPVGTQLGIVSFSYNATTLLNLTVLSTEADRKNAAHHLPKVYKGGTGIGYGLVLAKQMLERAKELKEGRIVLITDGEENVDPRIHDVKTQIVNSGVRVHAVAYSQDAARAIRNLTEETHGQYAYYSGKPQSTVLDAIIQTLMTDIAIYNKDVRMEIMRTTKGLIPNGDARGNITIDPTLGNDTMFVFTLPQNVPVTVTLVSPDEKTYSDISPEYSRDDTLKIVRFNFKRAQTGVWLYTLRSSQSGTVSLVVKALPGVDPYEVTSWLSSKKADLSTADKPVAVYVHVHKGYSPVIDADVTVTVERPSGLPVKLKPMDKGTLPDNLADDGVYSIYFTEYKGNERYSLDVDVRNIPGKTTYLKYGTPTYGAAIARFHNTTPPVQKVLADNFTRTTSPGAMDVKGFTPDKDNFPPSRVTDLKVVAFDNEMKTVTLTWTAPGDDLNTGTASDYELRMAQSVKELQQDFGKGLIVNPNMIISGSLKPKIANSKERIEVKTPAGWTTIVFALLTRDDANHPSDVSNFATATFNEVSIHGQPMVTTVQTTEGSSQPGTKEASIHGQPMMTTVQTPEGNPQPGANNGRNTGALLLPSFVEFLVTLLLLVWSSLLARE